MSGVTLPATEDDFIVTIALARPERRKALNRWMDLCQKASTQVEMERR